MATISFLLQQGHFYFILKLTKSFTEFIRRKNKIQLRKTKLKQMDQLKCACFLQMLFSKKRIIETPKKIFQLYFQRFFFRVCIESKT
jgi:hypothetical protein